MILSVWTVDRQQISTHFHSPFVWRRGTCWHAWSIEFKSKLPNHILAQIQDFPKFKMQASSLHFQKHTIYASPVVPWRPTSGGMWPSLQAAGSPSVVDLKSGRAVNLSTVFLRLLIFVGPFMCFLLFVQSHIWYLRNLDNIGPQKGTNFACGIGTALKCGTILGGFRIGQFWRKKRHEDQHGCWITTQWWNNSDHISSIQESK